MDGGLLENWGTFGSSLGKFQTGSATAVTPVVGGAPPQGSLLAAASTPPEDLGHLPAVAFGSTTDRAPEAASSTRAKGASCATEPEPVADSGPLDRMSRAELQAELDRLRAEVVACEEALQQRSQQAAQDQTQQPVLLNGGQPETQQPGENMRPHAAVTQQPSELRGAAICAALRPELRRIQEPLHKLDVQSRRSNLILHAPASATQPQILHACNAALPTTLSATMQLDHSALRPIRTQSTRNSLWHLRLEDGQIKHLLFGQSSSFRQQQIYLDDDLTKQQLDGRRSLQPYRQTLRERGHKTWWRRDTLFWADEHGIHSRAP